MTEKYLVDSNILIYALDASEGEKHEMAVAFMEEASFGGNAVLSTQNLAEFYVNITSPKKGKGLPEDISTQKLEELAETFETVSYGTETIIEGARLHREHKTHFWDALLAATMLENGIRTIYTENTKDFAKVPGIKALNPLK